MNMGKIADWEEKTVFMTEEQIRDNLEAMIRQSILHCDAEELVDLHHKINPDSKMPWADVRAHYMAEIERYSGLPTNDYDEFLESAHIMVVQAEQSMCKTCDNCGGEIIFDLEEGDTMHWTPENGLCEKESYPCYESDDKYSVFYTVTQYLGGIPSGTDIYTEENKAIQQWYDLIEEVEEDDFGTKREDSYEKGFWCKGNYEYRTDVLISKKEDL